MIAETFNRYEYKYLINESTFEKISDYLLEFLTPDKYNVDGNAYSIANLYYDTNNDFLIRTSLSKPAYKEKLRLRAYGIPSLSDKVFIEIKKKYKGIVNKRRTNIVLEDAYFFTENGYPSKVTSIMNRQVTSEITYFLKVYPAFPKLYLAYDRFAFFGKENSNIRVSFDTNIRTRRYDLRLEYGDYGEKLLDKELYLMEIKAENSIPLWLTKMLSDYEIKRMGFSKYGTEFKKYLSNAEMRCIANG